MVEARDWFAADDVIDSGFKGLCLEYVINEREVYPAKKDPLNGCVPKRNYPRAMARHR